MHIIGRDKILTIQDFMNEVSFAFKEGLPMPDTGRRVLDLFLNQVYLNGMLEAILESKINGMSGQFGQTHVMKFATGTKLMLTFTDQDKNWVSIITDDESNFRTESEYVEAFDETIPASDFGIQGLHCSLKQLEDMIAQVIIHWDVKEFKEDKNVGFGF